MVVDTPTIINNKILKSNQYSVLLIIPKHALPVAQARILLLVQFRETKAHSCLRGQTRISIHDQEDHD